MSLKDKVANIRAARKPGLFVIPGFDGNDVLNTLFGYVAELEAASSEVESLREEVAKLKAAKKPAAKKPAAKKADSKKK